MEHEIKRLEKEILDLQYKYYVLYESPISDKEFDKKFNKLKKLELQYPQFADKNSPTKRIGSDLVSDLPEKSHTIKVLSLGNLYSVEEAIDWLKKRTKDLGTKFQFIIELKIDGLSIVLYYKKGRLEQAITRGNGAIGNDVTDNIRTIKSIPLVLTEKIDTVARGEIYLPKDKFDAYNKIHNGKYENPRNAAAGAVRRHHSNKAAGCPLDTFFYEGHFKEDIPPNHEIILERLSALGFKVNPTYKIFGSTADIAPYIKEIEELRPTLPYEIDGLVFKIIDLQYQDRLGFSSHHPKWATAYKFKAPETTTKVSRMCVQIGRTGQITPVAYLNPVKLSGSTIRKATLHNLDYVNSLEIAVGDTVSISKRGDVIPAVEEVIEKNIDRNTTFKFPDNCPSCNTKLIKEKVHIFCKNTQCSYRQLEGLIFFCAKKQMDIRNLGEKAIEYMFTKNLVKDIPSLYTFDYSTLIGHEGYGKRKAEIFTEAIKKSKSQPFHRVLPSLGIEGFGHKNTELLIENGYKSILKIFELFHTNQENKLITIDGFGEKTIKVMKDNILMPETENLIQRLRSVGLYLVETITEKKEESTLNESMRGTTWVVTGSFEKFKPRDVAKGEIIKRRGNISSGISKKVTHLLVGDKPGGKLAKAEAIGTIKIIKEPEFLEMLK